MLAHFGARDFPWWAEEPYYYFRVLKFTRKGDLKVEIEAQLYPEDFYVDLDVVGVTCPAPSYVAHNVNAYAGQGVPLSPLAAEDDIALALFEGYRGDVATVPAGWTLLDSMTFHEGNTNYWFFRLYWKRITAAEVATPPTYTWTWAGTAVNPMAVSIHYYRDCHPTSPIEAYSHGFVDADNLPDTTVAVPAITTLGNNRRLVVLGQRAVPVVISTMPAEWNRRIPTTAGLVYSFDREQAAAGSSGIATITNSTSMTSGAFMVALRPTCESDFILPPTDPDVPGDPVLTLGQEVVAGLFGPEVKINGTLTFPGFHVPLRADIWVTPPGGVETLIQDNLAPLAGSFDAQFSYTPTAGAGEYVFRAAVETAEDPARAGGEDTASITISIPAYIFDVDLEPILDIDLSTLYDV